MASFKKIREALTPKPPDAKPEEIQGRLESLGQGLTLGFGDEIGAGLQAALAGDVDVYDKALSENRDIQHREFEREPVKAIGLEMAGSLPYLAAGPGKAAADGANAIGVASRIGMIPKLATNMGRITKAVAPLGFAQGVGKSESKDLGEQALDGVAGAAKATALGVGLQGAGNVALRAKPFQRLASELQRRAIVAKAGGNTKIPMELGAGPGGRGFTNEEAANIWSKLYPTNTPAQAAGTAAATPKAIGDTAQAATKIDPDQLKTLLQTLKL